MGPDSLWLMLAVGYPPESMGVYEMRWCGRRGERWYQEIARGMVHISAAGQVSVLTRRNALLYRLRAILAGPQGSSDSRTAALNPSSEGRE